MLCAGSRIVGKRRTPNVGNLTPDQIANPITGYFISFSEWNVVATHIPSLSAGTRRRTGESGLRCSKFDG
jgi:hypothetical protein